MWKTGVLFPYTEFLRFVSSSMKKDFFCRPMGDQSGVCFRTWEADCREDDWDSLPKAKVTRLASGGDVGRAIGRGLLSDSFAEYYSYRQKKGRRKAAFFLQVPRRFDDRRENLTNRLLDTIWWLIWDELYPNLSEWQTCHSANSREVMERICSK